MRDDLRLFRGREAVVWPFFELRCSSFVCSISLCVKKDECTNLYTNRDCKSFQSLISWKCLPWGVEMADFIPAIFISIRTPILGGNWVSVSIKLWMEMLGFKTNFNNFQRLSPLVATKQKQVLGAGMVHT